MILNAFVLAMVILFSSLVWHLARCALCKIASSNGVFAAYVAYIVAALI